MGFMKKIILRFTKQVSLFLLGAVAWGGSVQSVAAPRPNILYILADDLGYNDAGFMGSEEIHTPNLDRIARQGAVLTSFYVQPLCSPTRASLMTGRYVCHTGVYTVVRPHAPWGLPLEERTLAEALREAGYTTAIIGKWHLGEFQKAYLPTRRGFDHQYGHWFGALDYFTHLRNGELDWHRDDQICYDKGYTTHLLAKEACRWIQEIPKGKPFFLYLPFNAVHSPLQVPPEYTKPYQNLPKARRTYAGMVAAMDEAIGQVIDALEKKGVLNNTLIIFSSDNGGPRPGKWTSNKPLRAGKGTIYEGGVRVCAFATWPGHIPSGKKIDEPIHIIDWYPTLIKLAGGSLKQKLPIDGRDIWPVLTKGARSPHEALLLCGTSPNQVAVRKGDWKLLVYGYTPPSLKGQRPLKERVELYHLATDIGERKNLASRYPEKVRELRQELDRLMKDAVPMPAGAKAHLKQRSRSGSKK